MAMAMEFRIILGKYWFRFALCFSCKSKVYIFTNCADKMEHYKICQDETHYSLCNCYMVSDKVASLPIGYIILPLCKVIVGWMPLWPSDEVLIYYIAYNHIWGCHVNGHYPNFVTESKRDCKTAMRFWTNYQMPQILFCRSHRHTYNWVYVCECKGNHIIIKCICWKTVLFDIFFPVQYVCISDQSY